MQSTSQSVAAHHMPAVHSDPEPNPVTKARYYERRRPGQRLKKPERRALRAVRRFARRSKVTIGHDPRLSEVAENMAKRASAPALTLAAPALAANSVQVRPSSDERENQAAVGSTSASVALRRATMAARQLGVLDGELALVTAVLPKGLRLSRALAKLLRGRTDLMAFNRVGIGLHRQGDTRHLVLLFSRRIVKLKPLPAQVDAGTVIELRGRFLSPKPPQDTNERSVTAVLSLPGGNSKRRIIQVQQGSESFVGRVSMGSAVGRAVVQLVIERGRGPEVAAWFPVGVGVNPWDRSGGARKVKVQQAQMTTVLSDAASPSSDPTSLLQSLIEKERARHRLPSLRVSAALAAAALEHADDMRRRSYFAHLSPEGLSVGDRVLRRGVRYARVVENIALSGTANEALLQWLESPSHRANILDPEVAEIGVAVAPYAKGRVLAVMVMGKPIANGPVADLVSKVQSTLNARRRVLGLQPLRPDSSLDAIATRHSAAMENDGGIAVKGDSGNNDLLDDVFNTTAVDEAAADVYASDTVDVVLRSHNLRNHFRRLGVGVVRDSGKTETGRLLITVIYAR